MNYPSSNCGCDDSTAPTTGASGTAGCTGLEVPCITVEDGLITSLSSRTLTIPTQEVCPSDLCQEAATSNQVVAWNGSIWAPLTLPPSALGQQSATSGQVITWDGAAWAPADIPAAAVERELSFGLYDLVGASIAINSASDGLPAPDSTDFGVLLMDFNPTNYRLSVFSINLPGSPGIIGYSFEYSTDGTTWTPSGVTFDLNGTTSEIVTVTGTLTIPGSPSLVYIRPTYINDSGFDATFSGRSMYWTFWN